MAKQRFSDSDPVEEILRIAMQNQGGPDLALRQRLLASAAELGISEKAVLEAEEQWQHQKQQAAELGEYRAHTLGALYTHVGVYVVVNAGLIVMNLLTDHGKVNWAYWPILGWGIAVGIHLVAAMVQLRNPGGESLDEWRATRANGQKRVTVGVHIGGPSLNVDDNRERNQTQA